MTNSPPDADILKFVGGTTDMLTVTFSVPVTDPVVAICSLGASSKPRSLIFDRPIELLSFGRGYWGNGSLVLTDSVTVEGLEGHGVVRIPGTHTSFSWQNPEYESWSGVTVGVPIETTVSAGEIARPRSLAVSCLPNPFNPRTEIRFELTHRATVDLSVYDARGRLVYTATGNDLEPGEHAIPWHGEDAEGRAVASGAYFVKVVAGDSIGLGRVLLAR